MERRKLFMKQMECISYGICTAEDVVLKVLVGGMTHSDKTG